MNLFYENVLSTFSRLCWHKSCTVIRFNVAIFKMPFKLFLWIKVHQTHWRIVNLSAIGTLYLVTEVGETYS